jgi:hypothetical protein
MDSTVAGPPVQTFSTRFTYDGLGERLKKVSPWLTSLFPVGDDYEVTNGVVMKYVSVGGLGVVSKRVGSPPNVTTFWLHTDRLGSIQAITDATGAEVQRRTYRPYGEKIADTTSHWESRGWIDQRTDSETSLMLIRLTPNDQYVVCPAVARPTFPKTLAEFQVRFADEEACRAYLAASRWPDGYQCPRCRHPLAFELPRRCLWQCPSANVCVAR